jgi:hypothetical protein
VLSTRSAGDDLINLIVLVLDNASVAAESSELDQCLALWRRLQEQGEGAGPRWGADWALLAMAAADNTALCLEHYCDTLAGWVGGWTGGVRV